MGKPVKLRSRNDISLEYPVRVLETEPFLTPGTNMGSQGDFRIVHREVGTLPAERLRLPVPGSTWRLDGRVARTADNTVFAAFGAFLYTSTDEGRSWDGILLEGLPFTRGERTASLAFGAGGEYILTAHRASSLPPVGTYEEDNPADLRADRNIYPVVVSRSKDGGLDWEAGEPLEHPVYKVLHGDGNSLIELGGGTLLIAMDGIDPRKSDGESGCRAQVLFRSRDEGLTWGESSFIKNIAAETGLLCLGGDRVLAAMRGLPICRLGGKTVELADSEDGGRTWKNIRPLTRVIGQAHCDLTALPKGGVLAVYENRYPYKNGMDIRARVSRNAGKSWEPKLYILSRGAGYAGSVVCEDGTVITVAGDGQLDENGRPVKQEFTLQAVRWKPE